MNKVDQLIAKAKEQGIEIEILQWIDENRTDCLWYGGDIAKATRGNHVLIFGAYGDVRVHLNGEDGHEITYVKDKGNQGRFYDENHLYIKNDEELHGLIDNGQLELVDNNWIEWRVYDKSADKYIGPDCMDNIYDSCNVLDCLEVEDIIATIDYAIEYEEN